MAEPSPIRARRRRSRETGDVSIRNLLELAFVFLLVYVIFQVAPAVVTRLNFLSEIQVIANSPVEENEATLQQKVLRAAEGRSIVLEADRVHVHRNRATQTTTIDVSYELFLNFFPRFVYVWRVNDHVEALLL